MRSEAGVSKAYVIVTLMICMSFTGCIELDDSADDKSSSSLEEAFNDFIDSINTKNWRKYCSYILYTVEDNEIILANNTELDECEAGNETKFEGFSALRLTISNYIEEKLNYRAANNSGFVYSVDFTVEECVKEDDDEDWDCDDPNDESILWVEVGGQWVWWDQSSLDQSESAPIASFTVQEVDSDGIYHVDVLAINVDENLTGFNFYLKDDTGSTYVDGSNGFGKIALQNMSGVLYGIDTYYDGDDDGLKDRATNISNDNGTVWPVHFNDNDRDGKLSAGDQFMVYSSNNGANGPASDNWRLEIQFAATGDIVGSARMTS